MGTKRKARDVARDMALSALVLLTAVYAARRCAAATDSGAGALPPVPMDPTPQEVGSGASLSPVSVGSRVLSAPANSTISSPASVDMRPIGHDGFSEAAAFAEFADEMQPTADGLWARTVELWSTEEFIALSQDEAVKLLPVDDDIGFRGPDSWVALLGGLPTREDVDAAARDPQVLCALQSACSAEMVYRGLQMIPAESRSKDYWSALDRAERTHARAEEFLMASLDARSGYHHWQLLWKAWRSWSE